MKKQSMRIFNRIMAGTMAIILVVGLSHQGGIGAGVQAQKPTLPGIEQIVADANRIVNEASPIVDARLRDGSRVNVVLYPVALNGPAVTIRKFPKEPMTMQDLVQKHSLNQ